MILLYCRFSLLIDPQGQANRWIKNFEKGNYLNVIKFTDHDYMTVVQFSMKLGYPLLIENVNEELDAPMEPILRKQIFKLGNLV